MGKVPEDTVASRTQTLDRDWPQLAGPVRDHSLALAVGVFAVDGETAYLNDGMRALLGGDGPTRPRTDYFVNPRFADLRERSGDGEVFDGLLTVGDGLRVNHTLKARAWRRGARLLVAGEFDVLELDRLNSELSRTNQEINNLQRELIKKNRLLEDTLAQLRRAQAMLIHSEKMNALGKLVAGMAHEVNNPLGFVIGNLHSLRENVDDLRAGFDELEALARERGAAEAVDRVREAHDIGYIQADLAALFGATQDGLSRVKNIVENLRTFSRLHEAQRKTVDLREDLQSTLALANPAIQEKGIDVVLDLDGLASLECFPAQLNQVFMNLIVNAVQAMEQGGTLSIAGRTADEGSTVLTFSDTGAGIEPDVVDKIFDPFFTTRPVGSGTGLGLSIAHEIITDLHGGTIEVSTMPGEGSCFTLRLPPRLPEPGA
jgi:two-component system, NtrC family, sensor kinase